MLSFCTFFDKTYLARGLALIESLRINHPGCEIHVLALDKPTEEVLQWFANDDANPLYVTALAFLEEEYTPTARFLKAVKPTRTYQEYCWTLTPLWCEFALACAHTDALESITYVDADTFLFQPLDLVYQEIATANGGDGADIAITPHRFHQATARTHGMNGHYNVGFVYFRQSPTARALLDEWGRLCLEWCGSKAERDPAGEWRFGDQAYWDQLVPKYRVHSLKNIGVNLAPWNVNNYEFVHMGTGGIVNAPTAGGKGGGSRLFVVKRDLDSKAVQRIDPLSLYHFHAHTYYPKRSLFERGGYALPNWVVEWLYLPYEEKRREWTQEIKQLLAEQGVFDGE